MNLHEVFLDLLQRWFSSKSTESLTVVAKRLGLPPQNVAQFRSGTKPAPLHAVLTLCSDLKLALLVREGHTELVVDPGVFVGKRRVLRELPNLSAKTAVREAEMTAAKERAVSLFALGASVREVATHLGWSLWRAKVARKAWRDSVEPKP